MATTFSPATATDSELQQRAKDYAAKAAQMVREEDDGPSGERARQNLLRCAAACRAELARRAALAT